MLKKSSLLIILTVLVLLGLGLWGGQLYSLQYEPVDPNDTELLDINIPLATNAAGIASLLKSQGLIRHEGVFLFYCRKQGWEGQLRAGHYRFSPSQGLVEIARTIAQGSVIKQSITIPEGYTIKQIGELFVSQGICDEPTWQQVSKQAYTYDFLLEEYPAAVKYPLEGFLFPDTYVIEASTSVQEIVTAMLDRFEAVWNGGWAELAGEQERDVMEVITTASMIEREAQVAEDRSQIAGVIKNRLERGMLLQIDATVLYSLESNKDLVTLADLKVDSPYNTYIYPGLPPGPIACPGEAAIQAALTPAQHQYYYYVARGDGSHEFTATFAEHLAAQRRYAQ